MNDCYFDKNYQLTIISNWIRGRHREDISIFEPRLFDYRNLYAAAVEGEKTLTQLIAEGKTDGVSITDLIRAADPYNEGGFLADSVYTEAKAAALVCLRNIYINQLTHTGADVPEVTAKLLKVQDAIDSREAQPAASNLADTLIKSIEDDAKAGRLRYGRGFEDYDRRIGSMKRGQLIVLAARPATGKSAAALQIGYNVAEKGSKVLFFPLEMTTVETVERLLLQQQVVDSREAMEAPNDQEIKQIRLFLDDLEAEGRFLIYEGVNNLETINQIIKEQRPDLVIIDQLTQVKPSHKTKDVRERYMEVTAELKHTAIEYNTAILLLTQLNRASTDQSRPTLENLHESDATGQNADVVLLMKKQEVEGGPKSKKFPEITTYIVKNRGGEDDKQIYQVFDGSRYTFNRISSR